MNDIEVLEEYIKKLKLTPEELLKSGEIIKFIEYKEIKAIENLLKERQYYKECLEATSKYLNNIAYDQIPMAIEDLRQSYKAKIMHYEKLITNGLASKEITKLNEELLAEVQTNYIPKSLIKEKIEELNKEYKKLEETSDFIIADTIQPRIQVLEELLNGKM